MKEYITVYGDSAPSQFYKGFMRSWSREQREVKEYNVKRYCGMKPLYRINLRLKPKP